MKLRERLSGCRVLEIGSNTGFLALSLFDVTDQIVGVDINPYLIEISIEVAKFLNCKNSKFLSTTFEEFPQNEKFDVVLSFANHSTYDGNTQQHLTEYFHRCRDLFESRQDIHLGQGRVKNALTLAFNLLRCYAFDVVFFVRPIDPYSVN